MSSVSSTISTFFAISGGEFRLQRRIYLSIRSKSMEIVGFEAISEGNLIIRPDERHSLEDLKPEKRSICMPFDQRP